MERLVVNKLGNLLVKESEGQYKSPCFGCDNINSCNIENGETCGLYKVVEKLYEYERLEEQGLLLRLPCKVGDTVWDVDWFLTECIVKEFGFDEAGEVYCHYDSKDGIFSAKSYLEAFGSRLFLTKEEAEQKLAEGIGGE